MIYLVVCSVALLASALTLFSGFGLGTILLPAFALFFPIEAAVGATATIHLANNLFKLGLVGRHANRRIVLGFGLPAIPAAVIGAWLLTRLAEAPEIGRWHLGDREIRVDRVGLVVGVLIVGFALWELFPAADRLAFRPSLLPLGGVISGFFGGLSGHQGALRSAFLIRCGLTKEAFIATGVVCAVLVDVARIVVYGKSLLGGTMAALGSREALGPLLAASVAAFAGAFLGVRLLGKVTLYGVRRLVGGLLLGLGLALGSGIL